MTPYDFGLIAQEAYTAVPDIGIPVSASRAIIRQTEAGLVVAFPGTDNVRCWLTDLDAVTVPVSGAGDLHRGFWSAWLAIEKPVLAAIGTQPVTLVGHSLGAALALMAAISLALAGKPPVAVYGFEPPRVSTGIGARVALQNVPVHLYRNGRDVVPDVPLGWQHGGLLNDIGAASSVLPNVQDHMLARVLPALPGYSK